MPVWGLSPPTLPFLMFTRCSPAMLVYAGKMAGPFWRLAYSDEYHRTKPTTCFAVTFRCACLKTKMFDTLASTGEGKGFKKAVHALNDYYVPGVKTAYKEHAQRQVKKYQKWISRFVSHTVSTQLAQTFSFTDIDKESKNKIIVGCFSQKLRCSLKRAAGRW